jgi:hypothetical protein
MNGTRMRLRLVMADLLEDRLRDCTVRAVGGPMLGRRLLGAQRVLTRVHVIGNSAALAVRRCAG